VGVRRDQFQRSGKALIGPFDGAELVPQYRQRAIRLDKILKAPANTRKFGGTAFQVAAVLASQVQVAVSRSMSCPCLLRERTGGGRPLQHGWLWPVVGNP
jgi:hypothetical protein